MAPCRTNLPDHPADDNGGHLLCKPQLTLSIPFEYNQWNIFSFFCCTGARNTALAAIEEPPGRSAKVIAMAARLGLAEGRRTGVSGIATLQRPLELMQSMREAEPCLHTSARDICAETRRDYTQMHTETVDACVADIFDLPVFRLLCHATIHCGDHESLRGTDQSQFGHSCARPNGHFVQCNAAVFGQVDWEAARVHHFHVGHIFQLHYFGWVAPH